MYLTLDDTNSPFPIPITTRLLSSIPYALLVSTTPNIGSISKSLSTKSLRYIIPGTKSLSSKYLRGTKSLCSKSRMGIKSLSSKSLRGTKSLSSKSLRGTKSLRCTKSLSSKSLWGTKSSHPTQLQHAKVHSPYLTQPQSIPNPPNFKNPKLTQITQFLHSKALFTKFTKVHHSEAHSPNSNIPKLTSPNSPNFNMQKLTSPNYSELKNYTQKNFLGHTVLSAFAVVSKWRS